MATDDKGNRGMRHLAKGLGVAGLVVAAGLFQGCGDSGSQIRTSWVLTENGAEVQCAVGDTVEMRVDTDAMTVSFPCSTHSGVSPVVTGGVNHNVTLRLLDAGGNVLSETASMIIFVPTGAIVDTPDVEFPLDNGCADGMIQTSWILTQNGAQVQCAAGDEVDLRVDTDAMTVTFPCGAHTGLSPAVPGGVNHNVSLTLFDAGGKVLSQTGVMSLLVPCGTTKNTPQVDFSLTQ